MGEYQCPHCGHIITGFEQADFEAKRHELECLHAELARLRAELAQARATGFILAQFARWAIEEGPFQGCHLDGGDIQDMAAKLGILREEPYDPAIHGENGFGAESGDRWFVFTEDFDSTLRAAAQKESADAPGTGGW